MSLTRNHILRAIEEVKSSGYLSARESTKWDLIDPETGRRFPPKVVLHLAHEYAGWDSRPGGGYPTNGPLEAHGFTVVPKTDKAMDDAEEFLETFDDTALRTAAERAQKVSPLRFQATVETVARSAAVSAYIKRLARGCCDLCEKPGPFETKRGAYLECHHIHPLAKGGPDTIENTVALCPNCHRKMHYLDSATDREKLLSRITQRFQAGACP